MATQPNLAVAAGAAPADVRITRLRRSFETFGLVVDFLSRMEPFSRYDLGNFSRALQHQLAHGNHLAAVSGNRIVGYCGWLPTTSAIASAWVEDRGQLVPVLDGADAVAVTVVACRDNRTLAALIRQARALGPGKRLYFKRQYADASRTPRKSSVENVAR